jgi:hypothetical protein
MKLSHRLWLLLLGPFLLGLRSVSRARPRRNLRGLLFPHTSGPSIEVDRVEDVGREIAVGPPAKVFSATVHQGNGQTGIRKPLYVRQNDCRVRPLAVYYLGQIDPVIELQVGQERRTVLVDQATEAEASPSDVPEL